MEFKRVSVTPDLANALLNKNEKNRNLQKRRVQMYAADMSAGRWKATAQPVIVDADGRLQDGQHRLAAVVEAGVTVEMWVAYGADPEHFDSLDLGTPRTAGQVLNMGGVPQANLRAAAARHVLRYRRYPRLVWNSSSSISKSEVIEFVETHDIIIPAGAEMFRSHPGVSQSAWVACYHLIVSDSSAPGFWDDFADGVKLGIGLEEGDPRLALRNRGVVSAVQKWGSGQSDVLAILTAWNYYLSGKRVKFIKVMPTMLPMPKVQ